MTSWRIDPGGVVSTLTSVSLEADDLAVAAAPLASVVGDVQAGCADVAEVADALSTVLHTQVESLDVASRRIAAALLGASSATASYLQGDEEMAASTQAAAVEGDLRYFGIDP